ncbi:MAG: hypothetical protein COB02_10070 [Candidatus Cloacimonadota bacterium]|nr:MAG: hypothetical protein COB02_10070 [Candidatus Cloacimonadota bacterium]
MSQILNELDISDPRSLYDFVDRHNAFLINFLSFLLQDKDEIHKCFDTILNSAYKNFDKLKQKENQSLFLIRGCLKLTTNYPDSTSKIKLLSTSIFSQDPLPPISKNFFLDSEYDFISYHKTMVQSLSEYQYFLLQLLCVEKFSIDEISSLFKFSPTILEAYFFQLFMNLCDIDHTSINDDYDIYNTFSNYIKTPIHQISIDANSKYNVEESKLKKVLQLVGINRYNSLPEKFILKAVLKFFPQFELTDNQNDVNQESLIKQIRQQNEDNELEKYSQVQMNEEDVVQEYNVHHAKPLVNKNIFLYSKVAGVILIFFVFFTGYQSFQSPEKSFVYTGTSTKSSTNTKIIAKSNFIGTLYFADLEATPFSAGEKIQTKEQEAKIILNDKTEIIANEYTSFIMSDVQNLFLFQGDLQIFSDTKTPIHIQTSHGEIEIKKAHARIARLNKNYSLAASLKNKIKVLYNQKNHIVQENDQLIFGLEEKTVSQSYQSSSFSLATVRRNSTNSKHQFQSFSKSYNKLTRNEKREKVILLKHYKKKSDKKHLEFLQKL